MAVLAEEETNIPKDIARKHHDMPVMELAWWYTMALSYCSPPITAFPQLQALQPFGGRNARILYGPHPKLSCCVVSFLRRGQSPHGKCHHLRDCGDGKPMTDCTSSLKHIRCVYLIFKHIEEWRGKSCACLNTRYCPSAIRIGTPNYISATTIFMAWNCRSSLDIKPNILRFSNPLDVRDQIICACEKFHPAQFRGTAKVQPSKVPIRIQHKGTRIPPSSKGIIEFFVVKDSIGL
ncbi:hypothetical protein I7I48_08257 [Histoplasma ohiense]|nr:hypothetical protein I7I48_08257 [Histoplasma ohiense (nom. inval.)]